MELWVPFSSESFLSVSHPELRLVSALLLDTQRSFLPLGKRIVCFYLIRNNRRCR